MGDVYITKVCTKCKCALPLKSFSPASNNHRRLRARCTPCRGDDAYEAKLGRPMTEDERVERLSRRGCKGRKPRGFHKNQRSQKLWQKYEITPQQFDLVLASQGGCCAVCGTTDPKSKHNVFHVDHCHETGRIRGLLCNPCNLSIGLLGDTPEALFRAYQYVANNIDVVKGRAV